jgi:hypothetical protein
MLFAVVVIVILGVGIPAFFSGLVWYFCGLSKAKLSVRGALIVFVPGALTSFIFWGHAGPVPALMMLLTKGDGRYLPWALWMFGPAPFRWTVYRLSFLTLSSSKFFHRRSLPPKAVEALGFFT